MEQKKQVCGGDGLGLEWNQALSVSLIEFDVQIHHTVDMFKVDIRDKAQETF